MKFSKKHTIIVFFIIAGFIVVFRAFLPIIVQKYVSRVLNKSPNYAASIGDIDLHLYRGAYEIQNLSIKKVVGNFKKPLFQSDSIDLSVQWRELLKRRVVGEIDFFNPQIHIELNEKKQTGEEGNWSTAFQKLLPIDINRLGIHNGKINYNDRRKTPEFDVYFKNINGQTNNISTQRVETSSLSTVSHYSASLMDQGEAALILNWDPLMKDKNFYMKFEVKNGNLVEFNSLIKNKSGMDLNNGNYAVYMELFNIKGNADGYLKFFITDLDVIGPDEESDSLWDKIKETLAEWSSEVITNRKQETLAMDIPLKGKLNNVQVSSLKAFLSSIRHAFVEEIKRGFKN